MKALSVTSRILVLFVLITATFAAVTALRIAGELAPPSLVRSASPDIERASVRQTAEGILIGRENSLAALASSESPITLEGPTMPFRPDPAGDLALATKDATDVITSISSPGSLAASGYVMRSPILDSALGTADALYRVSVAEQAEIAVMIYKDLMVREAPFFLRRYGYRALANAVDRNVLVYRDNYCLPLYDQKSAFYQTESDTNNRNIDSLRGEAETGLALRASQLDNRYDALLDSIVANLADQLATDEIRIFNSENVVRTQASILERLALISSMTIDQSPEYAQTEMPPAGDRTWTQREIEFASAFRQAMGE
jgi:hypothetical protein